MSNLTPEQLLFEIEDVIRTMPQTQSLNNDSLDILSWLGRASAVMHAWDHIKASVYFDQHVGGLSGKSSLVTNNSIRGLVVMLHQAKNDLRMKTTGPLSVSVQKGGVFEYFDELRNVIQLARLDILFVDPFLDAEFVTRYLPFVTTGCKVRLLARKNMTALVAAANMYKQQHNLDIFVRSSNGLHDRYIIIDGSSCYQSGASFKDGAKNAGTTLTQITDAFSAVKDSYEALWEIATINELEAQVN